MVQGKDGGFCPLSHTHTHTLFTQPEKTGGSYSHCHVANNSPGQKIAWWEGRSPSSFALWPQSKSAPCIILHEVARRQLQLQHGMALSPYGEVVCCGLFLVAQVWLLRQKQPGFATALGCAQNTFSLSRHAQGFCL